MSKKLVAMDGNSAVAHVAHKTNEVIAIYPITPSSGMGEICDEKSAKGDKNIWGNTPIVSELQSEGGASGAVHGSLSAGALTTTFTASQGLLLMIPNMYKIAGELTPTVFHVSARAVATHALSIFGDHSDVMAFRQTGWAMFASANPQEAMDFALITQAATLESRVPFLHFFDGFRTSHELNMVDVLTDEQIKSFMDEKLIAEHKSRALNPECPIIKGTAQNPDVFFQSKEAGNKYYDACPEILKKHIVKFGEMTGRKYDLYEYFGNENAENIIITMASSADTVRTAMECMNDDKIGMLKINLYRPFYTKDFINAIPKSVKNIAVLDRTKEPGAQGEPLYKDVLASFLSKEAKAKFGGTIPTIVGGRYGLGSKEFTPGMVSAIYDNLVQSEPKNNFTVGINDDKSNTNLSLKPGCITNAEKDCFSAMFYGLGSDGTVGANKNTMKIISEETDNFAQGYFVYDSKKAGSLTVSHVRFGKDYIRMPYLIENANFVGCHMFTFLEKYNVLANIKQGGIFLLNSPYNKEEVWNQIPQEVQKQIIEKELKFFVIDASHIAEKTGMGSRTNTIMQTAFFAISNVIPKDKAIEDIKNAIKKTYGAKGEEIVNKNFASVDASVEGIQEVSYPKEATSELHVKPAVPQDAPDFVKEVLGESYAFRGDDIPVSKFPEDGTYPTATSQYEKRNIALHCPSWDSELCIQCGICSLVCPHAAIRIKTYEADQLEGAPETFKSADGKADLQGKKVTVQVAVEDCTGCGACIYACPAKSKTEEGKKAINFKDQIELRKTEIDNFAHFMKIKSADIPTKRETVKGSQLQRPLFEFSGACAGCGETPYIKLLTQLLGDRLTIANATGCSSIYGGNLPTTPYCKNDDGRGPAWANSLFEDNAEFGFGMRDAYDQLYSDGINLLTSCKETCLKDHTELADAIINNGQKTNEEVATQRDNAAKLKEILKGSDCENAGRLISFAEYLIKKSVWIIGGDGWAYDIGYGGLDHVLASGKNIKVLVLDTEVYSNTGGQMSKSTPYGAVAKFAAGGKTMPKKDLGMISMTYGNIYVAQISMGANYNQTVQALAEAEAYDGPAIVIAYSHCIAHGINMGAGMGEGKKAVQCGRWPLYRFNPELRDAGKNPLNIDSGKPTISLEDFMKGENRFKVLMKSNPERASKLMKMAEKESAWRLSVYRQLAEMNCNVEGEVESTEK